MVMRLDSARLQDVDALDAGDRAFQYLSDLTFDDLGRGARIGGGNGDHRLIDIGIFPHGQPVIGNDADQHQHQAHDGGENRPPNTDFRKGHRAAQLPWALVAGSAPIRTGMPSRSRPCPEVTTCVPSSMPCRISTSPARRLPVVTLFSLALPPTME
jgi:hypothetical protein